MIIKKANWAGAVALVLGIGLLVFINYKAATSSFTHDESFTTLHFFPQGEKDILLYRHPFTSVITNNHIFNTLMMKLSESLFGLSEWALRLPNILALGGYLFYGYQLCRLIRIPWLRLLSFVLLLSNPYLLDFFGVARGYGLSIGLMTGSFYYLIAYLRQGSGKRLAGFHLMGILSVLSNFALLNFYVAALGCFYLLPFLQGKSRRSAFVKNWKPHAWNMLAVMVLSLLLYTPFKVILENNTISFGGKEGFFANTVRSVVARSWYEFSLSESWIGWLGWLACLLVLAPSGLILWKAVKRQTDFFRTHTAFVAINTICWLIPLMTIVQHHLFGQDYLEERFAIFLYPLFALNVIFLCNWLQQQPRMALAGRLLWVSYGGAFLFITLANLNTGYYLNWKYDKDTKAVMQLLQDYRPEDDSSRKIGVFHQLEPTMNLYRRWWEMYWIEEFNREPPKPEDDFVFTREIELQALGITANSGVLFQSPATGMVLLKLR